MYKADPRTKFFIVLLLTTVVILFMDIRVQLGVTFLTGLVSHLFGVKLMSVFRKMRHFLMLLLGIVVIQSLFRNDGHVLVGIGSVRLLTDTGLSLAVGYLCRVAVIICSGALIATSSLRQNLQGLSQLGIPYELALMTGVGIRFLPMLMEEVNNAYMAMELRGVEVKKLPFRKRISMVSQLFIPIIYGTIVRAQKLSESIEARGFVIGQKRTSFYHLKMAGRDWMIVFGSGTVFCLTMYLLLT